MFIFLLKIITISNLLMRLVFAMTGVILNILTYFSIKITYTSLEDMFQD